MELEVLRECLIELVVVFLALSNLKEHINRLLDQVFEVNLEDFVLL